MGGEYDRHGFAYVVPAGEARAGERILMAQQDDDTVHVWRDQPDSTKQNESEVWHRCQPRTS